MKTLSEFNLDTLSGGLIALAVIVAIFLIIREIICWYWKINKAVNLLTDIRDLLSKNAVAPASELSSDKATESTRD